MNFLEKNINNLVSWSFDEKFYDDLKEAVLLGEQGFTFEQARSSVQNFLKTLSVDEDFYPYAGEDLSPKRSLEREKIIKQLVDDEKFINEFAQLFVISLKLYHFEKQNMLVIETATYDEFGLNKKWSFFTKNQFCYPLIIFKENGLSEKLMISILDVDYSFSLQECQENKKNKKILVENFASISNTSVDKIKEKLSINNSLITSCFEFDKNMPKFEFYLSNFLPQILQFYGLVGDREVFYTYHSNKFSDNKYYYFHSSLNNALHTSDKYNDYQAQMIGKYHKLIIIDEFLYERGYINKFKYNPNIFKNDESFLKYLLDGLGDNKIQPSVKSVKSVKFELTPRFIKFLKEFDPLWVFRQQHFDDCLVFLHDIQHLNKEQLPSGENIVEQTRLLWLCWWLGCQYPKNLSLACQKIKAIERFSSLGDDREWWFLIGYLPDETDYINFCYEKLGLPYSAYQTPPKLRINTLEQVYHDSLTYHDLYIQIDRFLIDNMSGNSAPKLFNVIEWLGKFDNPSDITIKPLLTQEDFSKESQLMGHCVSGYYSNTLQFNHAILHLEGDGGKSTLQLDFNSGQCDILQHKGVKNAEPLASHIQLAKKLCFVFDKKLKRRGNLTKFENAFEKQRRIVKDYYAQNPSENTKKPFTEDEWRSFFQLFGDFKSLKKLKKFLDRQKHGR